LIRYIGLTYGHIKGNVVANNGIYEGVDLILKSEEYFNPLV
jgi:hypothetical protein